MVSKALKMKIKWRGKGIKEKAYDENGNCIIECSKKYFRPAELTLSSATHQKRKNY